MTDHGADHPQEEPPPLLGTWPRLYGLLIAELLGLTAILYGLTRWAS